MNFLAHLYLAGDSTHARIGALLPDLVRGPVPNGIHPDILASVQLHRRIDAITDTHTIFARSLSRLTRVRSLYHGIVIDMFYDHILARDWARYHTQTLRSFINQVYDDFQRNEHLMSVAMRPPIQRMRQDDWLGSYATIQGMTCILKMMSTRLTQRLGREVQLADTIDDLVEQDNLLTTDFQAFSPTLMDQLKIEVSV